MDEYGETYGLEGVLRRWEVGKLTTEQAIGQLLLLLRQLDERVQELENRVGVVYTRPTSEGGKK